MAEREVTVSGNRNRCPYCHDTLGGETFTCSACQTTHHRKCWDEQGGCTVLGCAGNTEDRSVVRDKAAAGPHKLVWTEGPPGCFSAPVPDHYYQVDKPMIWSRSSDRPTPLRERSPQPSGPAPRQRADRWLIAISLALLAAAVIAMSIGVSRGIEMAVDTGFLLVSLGLTIGVWSHPSLTGTPSKAFRTMFGLSLLLSLAAGYALGLWYGVLAAMGLLYCAIFVLFSRRHPKDLY